MVVVGYVLLVMLFVYNIKGVKVPILSEQFVKSIAIAFGIGFPNFVRVSRQRSNVPSFFPHQLHLPLLIYCRRQTTVGRVRVNAIRALRVVFGSLMNTNCFLQTQAVGLTVFGVCTGAVLGVTYRYKAILYLALVLLALSSMASDRWFPNSAAVCVTMPKACAIH